MKFIVRFACLFLALSLLISCKKEAAPKCNTPSIEARDRCPGPESTMGLSSLELMNLYVLEQEITVEKRPDNLWYRIIDPGQGDGPMDTSSVEVDYVGYYRNHCRFDGADGANLDLSYLIKGWRLGLPLIGKCGTIQLIIPPSLAYGSNPTNVKKGEPLIFDIRLLDFE